VTFRSTLRTGGPQVGQVALSHLLSVSALIRQVKLRQPRICSPARIGMAIELRPSSTWWRGCQ
jgi:hypothetical protein